MIDWLQHVYFMQDILRRGGILSKQNVKPDLVENKIIYMNYKHLRFIGILLI